MWAAKAARRRWTGALGELWAILKITRVDYNARRRASWDVLYRWAPGAVKEGVNISIARSHLRAGEQIS